MKLQTNIPLAQQIHNQIDYHYKILLLGSCFSENIGNKFEYFKFQNCVNPFGIHFHPLAIETLVTNAINNTKYKEADLFEANGLWHCFDAHSKFSATNREEVLASLNVQLSLTKEFIEHASHIIITLGTAWVYRYIETDVVVANCHKVSQKKFLKELLSVDEISESLSSIEVLIKSVNPKSSILFTISPVRHLKDGFVENQRSKSHLITAVHQLVEPRKQVFYFPSYEIVMDELRDYRFYNNDMIHPNGLAVDYIWEKFKTIWISEDAQSIMEEVGTIQRGLQHRPLNPDSTENKKFLSNLHRMQIELRKSFPFIRF